MRVKESVREAEEVAGEAVAADVRALPDEVARRGAQRVVERHAELRAALVARAVRTDEEEGLARHLAALQVAARDGRRDVEL